MKTEHTPGPWKAVEERQVFRAGGKECIVGVDVMAGTEAIARVHNLGGDRLKEMQANARLIAAAPEMLEALRQLFDVLTVSGKHSYKAGSETGIAIEKARAIIAKAETL